MGGRPRVSETAGFVTFRAETLQFGVSEPQGTWIVPLQPLRRLPEVSPTGSEGLAWDGREKAKGEK